MQFGVGREHCIEQCVIARNEKTFSFGQKEVISEMLKDSLSRLLIFSKQHAAGLQKHLDLMFCLQTYVLQLMSTAFFYWGILVEGK